MNRTTLKSDSTVSSLPSSGASEHPTPTVHVIDDEESVREALLALLDSVGIAVRTYASGNEFLETYSPSQPECALVDERMPGVSGTALLDVMRERGIVVPTIILTGFPDVQMAVDAMKRGAFDFLCKPFREQELLDDVYRAIQKSSSQHEEQRERVEYERLLSRLTRRERDVLELVVTGEVNRLIAETLGISKRTVEVHRVRLMKKMHVGSVAELAMLTARFGTKVPATADYRS